VLVTALVTALDSWRKLREGDPKGWSTVLVTALGGGLGKPVPCSQLILPRNDNNDIALVVDSTQRQ
jgi:hypothetical protein